MESTEEGVYTRVAFRLCLPHVNNNYLLTERLPDRQFFSP